MISRVAALLLLLGAAAPLLAQDAPLTPVQFRDRLAAGMTAGTGASVTMVDERTFRLRRADGEELSIYTENAYGRYREDPSQLSSIISNFVATFVQSKDPDDDGLDQLVVIVRPSDYISRSVAPGASLANFPPSHEMAGDLAFFLAVDSPKSLRTARKADLERWKVDESAAWQRAIANGQKRMGSVQLLRYKGENGATGMVAESGLAPTLLADPAFCGPASPDGPGHMVILLLDRESFLLGTPNDEDMYARFWKAAKEEISAGSSLSSTPLTCRDGHWVVAKAP